jgi:hypothetical protein
MDDDSVGYLTWEQFERFRRAVHDSRKLIPWLRVAGYIRGGDSDELRHRSADHPLGLPPTWVAAEEISNLLQEINQWPELEDVALYGYEFAFTLTREVETAAARWPYEDKPHRVQYMECQTCFRVSLKWRPPRGAEDKVIVKCSHPECGAVMDEALFAFAAHIIETREHERRLGDRKSGRGEVRGDKADDLQVAG